MLLLAVSGVMLSIIERGHPVDSMLAQFVGIPFASFYGSKNSSGDDFAIHLQLADVLKRSTRQVVCLAYCDHLRWIEGQIMEKRIEV
jgi:hypothetical protein